MKYLYYSNSTYQILNVLNLNWNRKEKNFENITNYTSDLCILNVFDGAAEIAQTIKEMNVFENVFLANRVLSSGKLHALTSIKNIIDPYSYIKKCGNIEREKIKEQYDYIVVPKFSKVCAAIWQLNKKAKIQLYEDGLGEYVNTMHLSTFSKSYKLYKLFNYGRDFTQYEAMYLNKPSMFINQEDERIRKIPDFDLNLINQLRNTLFNNVLINDSKKFYWFGQNRKNRVDDICVEYLKKYTDDVLYFPHPRFSDFNQNIYDEAPKKRIWELMVLNIKDISNKCLISIDSTAAFSPKLLFNFEPYLIFTYKLLDKSLYSHYFPEFESFEKVLNSFINTYSEKKIYIPNNEKEFEDILSMISKKI